jgi:peptide/nickel transport system permease protein
MAAVLEEVRPAGDPGQAVAGRSPWALAARQLWRNRLAMASLALFLLIVVACFLAPFYAHIAHVDPFVNNLNGTTIVNGRRSR